MSWIPKAHILNWDEMLGPEYDSPQWLTEGMMGQVRSDGLRWC